MKLSSGPARVGALRAAGVDVGLGTDGEKENNNLDLLEEMKFAALFQKVSTLDPTTATPGTSWPWPRSTAPRASASETSTGSLEAGKRADVVTVGLGRLPTTPVLHGRDLNVAAHLVFSANGHDVRQCGSTAAGRDRPPHDLRGRVGARAAQAAAEELFAGADCPVQRVADRQPS